jgi:hypothetical protein
LAAASFVLDRERDAVLCGIEARLEERTGGADSSPQRVALDVAASIDQMVHGRGSAAHQRGITAAVQIQQRWVAMAEEARPRGGWEIAAVHKSRARQIAAPERERVNGLGAEKARAWVDASKRGGAAKVVVDLKVGGATAVGLSSDCA